MIGPRAANFHIFKKLKVTLGPLFPSFLRTKGGTFRVASFLSAESPCTRATIVQCGAAAPIPSAGGLLNRDFLFNLSQEAGIGAA